MIPYSNYKIILDARIISGKAIGIIITITVNIILGGCSSTKKGVDNTNKPNANYATNEKVSLSSNQQSLPHSKNTPANIKDITSKLLERIDTTKSQFEKGYYEYNGTINNIPITMSIYPLEKDIVGTYYYYYYYKHRNVINLKVKVNKVIKIKNYDKIFTVDYKQAISNARTRDLDATYQGIMVSNGLIWINDRTLAGDNSSKLTVIAINN